MRVLRLLLWPVVRYRERRERQRYAKCLAHIAQLEGELMPPVAALLTSPSKWLERQAGESRGWWLARNGLG